MNPFDIREDELPLSHYGKKSNNYNNVGKYNYRVIL